MQWLSGRVLDSRQKGRRLENHRRHCVVSLSKVSKDAKIRNRYNQVLLRHKAGQEGRGEILLENSFMR